MGQNGPSIPSMYAPDGAFLPLSEALKEVVSIPIILPGKMGDPYLAEKVLREGGADFIAWGRPLIADPEMPRKIAEGRLDEVRRCVYCNECLRVQWAHQAPLRCTVNPVAGREGRYGVIRGAEKKKRVVVIGAGPAGMEAARVAGLRGHEVILYEQSNELGGGQLKLASVSPHKDVLKHLVDYYTASLRKISNVKVILGKEVTAEEVMKSHPDAVILASGAEGFIPDASSAKSDKSITAHQVLSGEKTTGETVVVVGGGSVGCEVANYLAQQGKRVTVVEMLDSVATDIHSMVRVGLLEELNHYGVKILTGIRYEAVVGEGVEVVDRKSRKVRLKADTVVFAVGARARDQLVKDLKGNVQQLQLIGDAKEPRRIRDAISEAYMATYEI